MKHNSHNSSLALFRQSETFSRHTEFSFLRYCLGGTLYMPATRKVVDKIISKDLAALKSMVMCFEDALAEDQVETGERNALDELNRLAQAVDKGLMDDEDVPLIFLRVRNLDQFRRFTAILTPTVADILSGFVFPKFYSHNARDYLDHLGDIATRFDTTLYGMPILEGKALAFRESRTEELVTLAQILRAFHPLILNIRVGGTDFSSHFGLRRGINASIYDILPVRDTLSDILNVFARPEEDYVVSGPVWEYFLAYKQDDLEKLRKRNLHHALLSKDPIINDAIDGLLREVMLDKVNGFIGKTIIHPSHLGYVNAMQAVTREEFEDAEQILATNGGVVKSAQSNKMNESSPHRNWARRVILQARAYGVIEDESDYLDLFKAHRKASR